MTWEEIRELLPHRWVVVEALSARTENGRRVINHLHIAGVFGDKWQEAWERYKCLKDVDKSREYYFLHTDRLELDIGVMDSFGRILHTDS